MRKIINVHKDTITIGDTIICPDGFERTVCGKDIQYSSFMGTTIFGDSYKAGHALVKKVVFERIK